MRKAKSNDLADMARHWAGELDRAFWDQDGILLSALDADTESYVQHSRYAGRNSYENSIMGMGSLLEATIYKLRLKDNPQDRAMLARLLAAFDALFQSSGTPGLLFRPHQPSTSVDQMLYCAHAYDLALASAMLEPGLAAASRRRLGEMAAYWRASGYELPHPQGPIRYAGGRDAPLLLAFQALDAAHNGSAAARLAAEKLLADNREGLLTSSVQQARIAGTELISHPYVPQMYIYTIDVLRRYGWLNSAEAGRGYRAWVDGQANYWLVGNPRDRSGLPGSGQTFLTIVYDGKTDTSAPPPPGRFSGRARGDAWHVAYVNAAAYGYFRDNAYLDLARQILQSCSPDQMRWSATADPGELEPNSVFTEVCNWYNGYGMACWLQTYWLLQWLGGCRTLHVQSPPSS